MDIDISFDIPETFNMASVLVDRHVAEGRGDHVAIYAADETITYSELQVRVNKAGNMLKNAGIEIEDRVMLLMTDRPEFVATYVAAMKIGAVPVPVNPASKVEDLAYYVDDSRAAALIADESFARHLASYHGTFRYLKRVFVILEGSDPSATAILTGRLTPRGEELSYRQAFAAASDQLETEPTSCDDPSYWLYSSGTTGAPKGTVHLQQDMVYCTGTWIREVLKPTADDRNFTVSKLFTSYGLVNGLYQPLMAGIGTVLMADARPTPAAIADTIRRARPTVIFTVPGLYAAILNDVEDGKLEIDLSSVRMCVSAGEALPPATYERWHKTFGLELLDGIGSTEFGYIYIQNMPGRSRPGASGELLPGYVAEIRDDSGEHPVRIGETGELFMQSPSFAAYYWKKRDKTRDTFRGPWLKTGDLYTADAEGYYHYIGRADDTFKVNAQWVSPVEVEGLLMRHQSVAEVAVVPFKDEEGQVRPRAHVVLRDGYAGTEELAAELKEHVIGCLERPQYYKYPRQIVFEDRALPRNAAGKVQRFILRQR